MYEDFYFLVRCELDDPVLINFINKMQDIQENVGAGLPADAIPMLRYLPLQSHKKFIRAFDSWHKYIDQIYEERVKNFDESKAFFTSNNVL